jgi:DNA-binding Lrp family transcriptional regulator
MTGDTTGGIHAELFVRSLAPRGVRTRQQAVVERLQELTERGTVGGYTVHVCGKQVPARAADATTEFGAYLLDRIGVFEKWADRNGWSLESLFERHSLDSSITGEHTEVIVMPVMALAEYEDDDLRFVAPCSTGEQRCSIQDRLDDLLADDRPTEADRLTEVRNPPPTTGAPIRQ